jgi:non-ribosomal peptide synthetase component F
MAIHFERLLEAAVSNPDEQVSRLRLMTQNRKGMRSCICGTTPAEITATDNPLHLAFAKQAALTPDAVAVRFEQHKLTYRELNQRGIRYGPLFAKPGCRAGNPGPASF